MKDTYKFTFIDLFAGIGGFHQAMHDLGGKCVFASEIDVHARKTYQHNFSKINPNIFKNENFNKDIKTILPEEIPDFDILCAGFPCQPFSQAGKRQGFHDGLKSERGNLFFDIVEIIKAKEPQAFFLENVRGIVNHDGGNTFSVIKDILTKELGYSFHYQIVKASDYGLPQLRPRVFMVGFKDKGVPNFEFPPKIPLKFNMSDVWGGKCTREIGFTLRVGGRGSNINDRRNWDHYEIDGEVKRVSHKEAAMMQGFPALFEFPVSATQAIKQLGNSVAIDAIRAVGNELVKHIETTVNSKGNNLKKTKNKGEWSELFSFIKLLLEQKVHLSDENLNKKDDFFKISKVTTKNLDLNFFILDGCTVESVNINTDEKRTINIQNIITPTVLNNLLNKIKTGTATFEIPDFDIIQNDLGFTLIKGGNSNQKSDIVLDIEHSTFKKENEGFGIKSYLGADPTLLNASGKTNFLFKIVLSNKVNIDEVNGIKSRTKIKDRINLIASQGGALKYIRAEKDTMNYNLKMIDSHMPEIIGYMLLAFYEKRIAKVSDVVDYLADETDMLTVLDIDDKLMLQNKIKKFLVGIMLGVFSGKNWDGEYESKGTIVVKSQGDLVSFHIIEIEELQNYLYKSIKFDTPSSTRHKFGTIIQNGNNELLFKLNLQLRF
jgi:DNA (cytosine-5)-methyltransferase 1